MISGKPQPLSYGIMASAVGDKIYAFSWKKVFEYNTITDTWTPKKDIIS